MRVRPTTVRSTRRPERGSSGAARVLLPIVILVTVVSLALVAGGYAASSGRAATPGTVDKNGTLVVGYASDPARFDPRQVVNAFRRNVDMSVFDLLVTKDFYHPDKPLNIVPGLATGWTLSKDRRTYTFTLRRGVTFHDGTPFNADAVVFTFRSIIDPAFQYYCAACNTASKRDNSMIESVRKLGQFRVAVTLKDPFGGFVEVLSVQSQFAIVSPTAIRENGNDYFNMHPVGTGYMRFVEYVPGQRVVLQRNTKHWRGPTAYKWLVLRPMSDGVARANALQAGEISIADDLSPSYISAWKGRTDITTVVRSKPQQYACHLNYRGGGPTSKKALREALSLAANRGAMNIVIFDRKSNRSHGWYAPGNPAYDRKSPPLEYNLTKARQLLGQAGYSDGVKIRFEVATVTPDDPKILAIWQQSLRQIGVDLQIKTVDLGTWVGDWNRGLPPYPTGQDGLCLASGSDINWALAQFAGSYGIVEGANYNTGGYNNPQAEAAYKKAAAATTLDDYYAGLTAANKIVTNDYGILFPSMYNLNIFGVASNVKWTPARALQRLWYNAVVYKK